MNIKEVVFPIDFSRHGVEAAPYAAALTRRLGAKLTLLHVVERQPPGSRPLDGVNIGGEVESKQQEELANRALMAFQQQYLSQVPSQIRVLGGDAAQAIAGYGGESDGRMIVMPTRGFGPFRQMLIGSVTAKVLHDSKCPVVTGPHLEAAIHPTEWFELRRILCALAMDWETDRVLKESAELAQQVGAELIAVHVVTPVEEGLLPLIEPGSPPISTGSVRKAMQDTLHRMGVSAQVQVSVGEPSRRVASAARECNADLIVIGKGGGPELPGRLGSHGYAIVRRAPCPVLCV